MQKKSIDAKSLLIALFSDNLDINEPFFVLIRGKTIGDVKIVM